MIQNGFLKVAILLFALSAVVAYAGDGQVDILPSGSETFTITESGSYVLTGNVAMTADVTCIDVNAHNVTINLNGHTLTGTESGTGDGINSTNYNNLHIFNGMVTKFGGSGIAGYSGAVISEVTATENGVNGIYAGSNVCITNCVARKNFKWGIKVGNSGVITSCSSYDNNEAGDCAGIEVLSNCSVIGCVSNNNIYSGSENKDAYGIKAWKFNLIKDNVCVVNNATQNGAYNKSCGIYTDEGCTIINNTCADQEGNGQYTDSYGIYASNGCTISGNSCFRNRALGDSGDAFGISCADGCTVINNTCRDNDTTIAAGGQAIGIKVGDSSFVRGNTCSDQTTAGSSSAMGISGDNGCRIEKNLCNGNQGESVNSCGIYIKTGLEKCSVIDNTTYDNTTGINLSSGSHYCAENVCSDGITNTSSAILGTGDRSNITY